MTGNYAEAARGTSAVTGRAWRSGRDWTSLVLGAYLAVAPIWTDGASWLWFATLGVLIVAVAVWALSTMSPTGSQGTLIVLGVATFAAPWIGGFAGSGFLGFSGADLAGWTAWLVGAAVALLAITGLATTKSTE